MNCLKCGYSVYDHAKAKREFFSTMVIVDAGLARCSLSEAEALAAAQRAAAIAHLRHYGLLACKWRKAQCNKELTVLQHDFLYKCEMDTMNKIFFAIAAYRAVGILKGPKP